MGLVWARTLTLPPHYCVTLGCSLSCLRDRELIWKMGSAEGEPRGWGEDSGPVRGPTPCLEPQLLLCSCCCCPNVFLMEGGEKGDWPFPHFSASFCLSNSGNQKGWGPLFPPSLINRSGEGLPRHTANGGHGPVRLTFVKAGWGHSEGLGNGHLRKKRAREPQWRCLGFPKLNPDQMPYIRAAAVDTPATSSGVSWASAISFVHRTLRESHPVSALGWALRHLRPSLAPARGA